MSHSVLVAVTGYLCLSIAAVAAVLYVISLPRLLGYRFLVARSTGYLLALGSSVVVFLVVTSTLIHLLSGDRLSLLGAVLFAIFNVATAVAFRPTKNFFDRVTNSVFYQDAYDAQELIDSLNRLFVTNTNIEQLLRGSAAIIQDTLHAEFCFFGIKESDQAPQRIIGHGKHHIKASDIEAARRLTPHIHEKVIVTSELAEEFAPLRAVLEAHNVAILGRLTPNTRKTAEGFGYLVLGARRSGNPYTAQDLRTLGIIVNELVIATENSLRFEQIQHFNETLQASVTEATRKLRRGNDKLQQLDATKDEFITMASHQLRTPLTSVKGYLSMVLEGDAGEITDQQRELLTQSYISSQRMVYLIADLLNLSRLSTGKFIIEPSKVDLADIVQSEVDQLRETAKSRNVTLTYNRPADFPALMLDETKIHQVVMNFIDNAVYYTRGGGAIEVGLRETPTAIEYTVKDNGIGVPKSEQHKLFAKFYRAGNARLARPDGTGLGLFMAKKVIVEQGGSLIFDSTEGKGSTFGFRFTKAKHLAPTVVADTPSTDS